MEKWGEMNLSFTDKQLYEHWKIIKPYFLPNCVLSLIDFLSKKKDATEAFFHNLQWCSPA